MRSVFQREARAHLLSPVSLIFMSLFLVASGIMLTAFNLVLGAAGLDAVLPWLMVAVALLLPLLGLRFFGKRTGEQDLLLASLPVTYGGRMVGKYLAMLAVVAIPTAVLLLYPFVLAYVATVSFGTVYLQILALFLCEAAMLAIVFFLFAFCRRRWTALLASYLTFVISHVLGSMGGLTSVSWLRALLRGCSFFTRLDTFVFGLFDLKSVWLFLSLTMLFVALAIPASRRGEGKPLRETLTPRRSRRLCLLLALLLLSNVAISLLPRRASQLDITESGKYALSDSTEAFLKSLDTDVTVYLLSTDYSDSVYRRFLERFCSYSDRLTLKAVDLDADAEFFSAHGLVAENIAAGSLVIESDKRFRYIPESNLLSYSNSELGFSNITKSQYQNFEYNLNLYYQICASNAQYSAQAEQYAAQLFSLYYSTTTNFSGDRVLATSVDYVTAESVPILYALTGHGETAVRDSVLGDRALYAFEEPVRELNLRQERAIPSDASALIINCPKTDLDESELAAIRQYTDGGGRLMLLTDTAFLSLETFGKLTASYGMSALAGPVTVTETEAETKAEKETVLLAGAPNTEHDGLVGYVGASESNYPTLKQADSILLAPSETTPYLLTPLLTSAEDAYLPTDPTQKKAHILAASAEHESGMQVVWITGAEAFNNEALMTSNNAAFLMFTLNFTRVTFRSELPAAAPVLFSLPNLGTTTTNVAVFGFLLVLLIPAVILGAGLVARYRRKRRMPKEMV